MMSLLSAIMQKPTAFFVDKQTHQPMKVHPTYWTDMNALPDKGDYFSMKLHGGCVTQPLYICIFVFMAKLAALARLTEDSTTIDC